jgi:hypothetical protein
MQNAYTIDRKTASRLLKVSIRTVDRYIRANKLRIEERDGRIWLNKKEVQRRKPARYIVSGEPVKYPKMSIDKMGYEPVDMSIDNVHFVSTEGSQIKAGRRELSTESVYQKLFEELQTDLKNKQERLEGANYRVGQLEALLKDSIPRLDHNHLLLAERAQKEELEAQNLSLKIEHDQLEERFRDEKFTKKILIAFIFALMLIQPIMLLITLKK